MKQSLIKKFNIWVCSKIGHTRVKGKEVWSDTDGWKSVCKRCSAVYALSKKEVIALKLVYRCNPLTGYNMKILQEYTTEELEQEIIRRNEIQETWTDPETGLEWQTGYVCEMNWEEAIKYVGELVLDGKSDWRLPTRKELFSLVSNTRIDPCIKTKKLSCVSSGYWSSTTHANNTSRAWSVYFNNGYVNNYYKTNNNYVRCVRGGSESTTFKED